MLLISLLAFVDDNVLFFFIKYVAHSYLMRLEALTCHK